MARQFKTSKSCVSAFNKHKAQLFISGGHGGLVTYDGKGGAMVKEGGPMDRIFFFRNDGLLVGDAGLDLLYGHINIRTGSLKGSVNIQKKTGHDTSVHFSFDGLKSMSAFEIKGSIIELGLPRDTVIISGNISKSEMVWETGNLSGQEQSLPYTAFHPKVKVHQSLVDWFGVSNLQVVGAETTWCKKAPVLMDINKSSNTGVKFRTQQHLGYLRVLLG